jgi:transcriptional regulator with XRE-family HTH domain
MKLQDWMHINGLKDGNVAKRLGVSRATVSRLRRAKQLPKWDLVSKIRDETGGQVTADDFMPTRRYVQKI